MFGSRCKDDDDDGIFPPKTHTPPHHPQPPAAQLPETKPEVADLPLPPPAESLEGLEGPSPVGFPSFPEGCLIETDYNAECLYCFKPTTLELLYKTPKLPRGPLRVEVFTMHPEPLVVVTEAGKYPCSIRTYEVATGKMGREVATTDEGTYALAVVPSVAWCDEGSWPRILTGDRCKHLIVWDTNEKKKLRELPGVPRVIRRIRYVRELGDFVWSCGGSSSDGGPQKHSLRDGELVHVCGHGKLSANKFGTSNGLGLNPVRQTLLTCGSKCGIFSTSTGDLLHAVDLKPLCYNSYCVSVIPDKNAFMIGLSNGSAAVWDERSLSAPLHKFTPSSTTIHDIVRTGIETFAIASRGSGAAASFHFNGKVIAEDKAASWRYGMCSVGGPFDRTRFPVVGDEYLLERIGFLSETCESRGLFRQCRVAKGGVELSLQVPLWS